MVSPEQGRVSGAGLGLRRALMAPLEADDGLWPDFLEVAPENWIRVGGGFGRRFAALAERRPLVCHGLSLSLGSPDPLDWQFLGEVRDFLRRHRVQK